MTYRDQFIDFLARLVSDTLISEVDAKELLKQFDAGMLDWDLPEPPKAYEHDDKTEEAALALLLLLLGQDVVTKLPTETARRFSDELQTQYQNEVTVIAAVPARIRVWQQKMLEAIELHTIAQTLLGSGVNSLTPEQIDRLTQTMTEQGAFLQRFADHMAYNAGTGEPYSEEYIANRSTMYGGVGRAAFYVGVVDSLDGGDGIVLEYVARDDRGTCEPCHAAQGFYLPDGPYPTPGSICLGGGNCRCSLTPVYRPDIYAQLTR